MAHHIDPNGIKQRIIPVVLEGKEDQSFVCV